MSNSEWGAIRRSLADSVSNVIKKKMGTSSGYKPSEWAEQINLMGALPEKTVSGGVANFSDGANDVPVKSAKFYFLPQQAEGTPSPSSPLAITGRTGLTGYRQKKNLIDDSLRGTNGANIFFGHTSGNQYDFAIRLKKGTYTFSVVTADGTQSNLYIRNSDTNTSISGFPAYNVLSKSFTLEEDTNLSVWVYKSGYTSVTDITSAQIEVGSSATTYEAYQAPTSYPVTWQDSAGTIYGGYVDAVRGKVVKTHFLVTLNVSDMDNSDSYPGWKNSGIKQFVDAQDIVLDDAKTTIGDGIGINTTGTKDILYLPKALHNNLSQTQWQTNYPDLEITIAVPYKESSYTEYDIVAFTPNTYYGSNNFYADANGDSEVTYRRDITLALQESGT